MWKILLYIFLLTIIFGHIGYNIWQKQVKSSVAIELVYLYTLQKTMSKSTMHYLLGFVYLQFYRQHVLLCIGMLGGIGCFSYCLWIITDLLIEIFDNFVWTGVKYVLPIRSSILI